MSDDRATRKFLNHSLSLGFETLGDRRLGRMYCRSIHSTGKILRPFKDQGRSSGIKKKKKKKKEGKGRSKKKKKTNEQNEAEGWKGGRA